GLRDVYPSRSAAPRTSPLSAALQMVSTRLLWAMGIASHTTCARSRIIRAKGELRGLPDPLSYFGRGIDAIRRWLTENLLSAPPPPSDRNATSPLRTARTSGLSSDVLLGYGPPDGTARACGRSLDLRGHRRLLASQAGDDGGEGFQPGVECDEV